MALDPALKTLLDQLAAQGGPDVRDLSPPEARELFKGMALLDAEAEAVDEVTNLGVPGPGGDIAVRVYRNSGPASGVVVYYHGGGWTIGDLDTHDAVCRRLANRCGATVVSVDYRLAPEHPFPAAADDAWAALRWAAEHRDALGAAGRPLAVAGDSAGGNLAAVVANRAAAAGDPPVALQVLVYPVTDCTLSQPSMDENAEGYLLTRDTMAWFVDNYVGSADPKDPDASPLYCEPADGLAPAVVITAEFDPLRDEGEAYAARLRDAGVPVELTRYDGMIHGFFALGGVTPRAADATDAVAAAVRRAFS